MREKLLSLELLINGGAGLALVLVPTVVGRLLGWGAPGSLVWPRLAGGLLLGIATATGAQLAGWSGAAAVGGLGLAGHVAINFVLSFVLLSIAVVGAPLPTRRGKWVAAVLALALLVLGLIEISYLGH